MSISQIIEGTIKNLLNKDEALFIERIAICRKCPLIKMDSVFGELCDSSTYIDPITNKTSLGPLPGYAHGCGCILGSKARVLDAHCPVGKW